MNKNILKTIILMVCLIFMFSACSGIPKVKRIEASQLTDLTGYWNDNDVDIVCKDLIGKFLEAPRIAEFSRKYGRIPVVRIGNFKNASSEPIDTTIISKRLQVQLLNSGKVNFRSDMELAEELRREAEDQQSWVDEADAVRLAKEIGADFLLTGAVKTIIQTAAGEQVRYYTVTAEATDIESHMLIWSEENGSIKKTVKRANYKP